jgi:murein DD-endopeptidase MepM/ murein hydrolase activator NlpD
MIARILASALFGGTLAVALVVLSVRRAPTAEALPVLIPTPVIEQAQQVADDPREQWALDFLARLGNTQPSREVVTMIVEWTLAEDSGEGAFVRNNPLNTTLCLPGAMTGAINGDGACGVQGYATWEDGIEANARTLEQANFETVRAAILANDADAARQALWASPWAASHYGYGSAWPRLQGTPGAKCPVTSTMAVSANFYSTGSPYWAGQAGGMHNGTDFSGQPGEPVYAPFDFTVEDIQYYGDPGRIGYYVQGRFDDGYLFYAGHLGEVYTQVGARVTACEQIGTIGAVFHTHVKIAPASAPVPCEASGCEDFEAYWSER